VLGSATFHQALNPGTNTMTYKARHRSGANWWVKTAPKDARVNRTVLLFRAHRAPSLSATMHEPLNSASERDQLGLAAIRDLC
jgi:hypothetical protein